MSLKMLQWVARMSTPNDLIRKWVNHNRQVHSGRTHRLYSMVIWRFAEGLPENIKHITPEHIERYIQKMLDSNLSRRYCNVHLTAIKSFFRWASLNNGLANPASKVKMLKEDPPHQRVLSPKEYEKLLSAADETETDLIIFIADTGLRTSELQSLRWGNIDASVRFLTICGKGRKRRSVPLNKTLQAMLSKYPRKPKNFPLDFTKSYLRRNAVYALLKRLSRRAGIPTLGPHALRRYFADSLRRKGVPIYTISKLLGHADVRTTEIYLHWGEADVLGVTDCLDE